jgi:hypothetical protein
VEQAQTHDTTTDRAVGAQREQVRQVSVRANRLITFAKHMLLHGDVVRAAADAGAQGTEAQLRKTGEAWLKHPDVKDVLAAKSRKDVLIEAVTSAAVTALKHELDSREGRMAWLKRVVDGTESSTKIAHLTGEEITAEPEMKDRLAAFKMLAHMHGDFVERKEIAVSNTARVVAIVYDNGRGPLPPDAEIVAEIPADLEAV